MGKIVVTEFMSLDGVVEDPGGSEDFDYGGWSFEFERGDDGNEFKTVETMQASSRTSSTRCRSTSCPRR